MMTKRFALLAGLLLAPTVSIAAPDATPSATITVDARRTALLNQVDSLQAKIREDLSGYSRRMRSRTWTMEGVKLSATQAEELEMALTKDPEDLASRLRLIGWLSKSDIFDARLRSQLNEHVQWLIDHQASEGPEFWAPLNAISHLAGPEANLRASESWKRQVAAQPSSTPLLESAANFLSYSNPKLSLEWYARAAKIAPRDPRWPEKIADTHLHGTHTRDRELQYSEASAALRHYEQALALTPEDAEAYSDLHQHAAEAAWLADRNDKAARWANLLLKRVRADEWWYNNTRHAAYTILGLVAVDDGDLNAAGKHLMLSVDIDVKGTGIFNPSLVLAAAVLKGGRKDVVIEYLETLKSQAHYMPERYDVMIESVRAGEIPDAFASERKKLAKRKPPKR